jgi:hypothetical protein
MQLLLAVWLGLVGWIARKTVGDSSVGLPLAFVLAMTFLYGGCFVYAVPGYTHSRPDGSWYLKSYNFTEMMVVEGAAVSLLGLIGFVIGVALVRRRALQLAVPFKAVSSAGQRNVMIALGAISGCCILLQQAEISFPLYGAVFELGRNILATLICLGAYSARRNGRSILPWLGLAAVVPVYYMIEFGLASYGLVFVMTLTGFYIAQVRTNPRNNLSWIKVTIVSAFSVQLILTAFVGWMSFRDQWRAITWDGEEGSVLSIALQAVRETELFSVFNFAALDIVNMRLNLPLFIGRMMDHHSQFPDLQLWGSTLVTIPLTIVPRFLWPEKPERGGSGFMSEHTGIRLSDSATFGSGSVFEFYVNFGYLGVFFGFIALGWLLRRVDIAAFSSLARGKYIDFARFYVVGLVALDPLLRPFFIFNGMLFAWIALGILKIALLKKTRTPNNKARSNFYREVK